MALTELPPPQHRLKMVIEPTHGLAALNFKELWAYRDLLIILAGRDIQLRYKQTALGVIWVILQPLVAAIIFAVIFGNFARLPSDGSPYLLFVFCGLLPWNLFSGAISRAGNSLVGSSNLISKVYFPRLMIPLSSTAATVVDFVVSLGMLVVFMIIYQVPLTWRVLAMPFFVLLTFLAATGVGLWLTALNVYYRDFMYAMPFLIQVWLYASPVAYASSLVPEPYRWAYSLNPAAAFIEGFRWSMLGQASLTVEMVISASVVSLLLLISGVLLFRRVERGFADVI